jgi:hypothetical protein
MNYRFVCKRFVQAFVAAFVLLFALYIVRGQPTAKAAVDAALWSVISAGIFSAAVMRNIRRKSACVVCQQQPAGVD